MTLLSTRNRPVGPAESKKPAHGTSPEKSKNSMLINSSGLVAQVGDEQVNTPDDPEEKQVIPEWQPESGI